MRRLHGCKAAAATIALTAFAALGFAPPAAQAEHGLAAQWHLDDGPFNPVTMDYQTPDSSGNGLAGGSGAAYSFTPGRFGQGMNGFASPWPRVLMNNNVLLQPAQVTVAAWVKAAAYPGELQYVVAKGGAADCNGGSYALYTGFGPAPYERRGLQFYFRDPSGTAHWSPRTNAVWDNQWHAVAGTYDGAAVRLYVDGHEVETGTPATESINYSAPGSLQAMIGGNPYSSVCPSAYATYTGAADEVRIYSRALDSAEIGRLQNPAATSPPDVDVTAGPPPPGPPLSVKLAALASTKFKTTAPVTLTAKATGGAAIDRYVWDFGAAGSTPCNGQSPAVDQTFAKPYTGPVKVTAYDVLGNSSTATANISVAAAPSALRSTVAKALGPKLASKLIPADQVSPYPFALCKPAPGSPAIDITPKGGPKAGCVNEVIAGLVSAIGCLSKVGRDQLPAAERRVLYPILDSGISAALGVDYTTRFPGLHRAKASAAPPEYAASEQLTSGLVGAYYMSTSAVRVNGVDYQPAAGARIVVVAGGLVADQESYVASSNATVSVNGVPLRRGPLRLQVDLDKRRVHVTDFSLSRDVPFAAGLSMARGTTSLDIVNRGSLLGTHIGLPGIFGGTTGEATVRLSNPKGAVLNNLRIGLGQFELAGVGVDHADLMYNASPLSLVGDAEVKVAPEGPTLSARLELGGGTSGKTLTFRKFAGEYFGPPYIPLAPGIDLTGIRGKFDLFPPATELGAGATVTVGAPIACAPYRVDGDVVAHFYPPPVAFDFTGQGSLFCVPVASEYLHVDDTGYVTFGGRVKLDAKVVSLEGQVDAQWLFPHFQAEGTERICIAGYLCANGNGIVSDRGVAACLRVRIEVLGVGGTLAVGAGFDWPPPATLVNPVLTAGAILSSGRVFTGCGFGHWKTVAAHAAASGERSVTIPAGLPAFSLAVDGRGGAPDVELRGPKGESYVLPASGPFTGRGATGFRSPVEPTAYFAVAKPSAGRWTVVPRAGSAPITRVRTAEGLPEPSVELTRLSARRGQFAYRYAVKPIAGQKVTFVERAKGGERRLATTSAAAGVLRFSPSDASGTQRSIVALVQQDGQPRDNITLARFTAAPPKPGRPPRLRARRRGTSLVITWGSAAKAQSYEARVRLSDGRSLFFTRAARARSFTVRGVAKATRATVRVAGLRGRSRTGPAAVLRIAAAKRHPAAAGRASAA